MQFERLWDRAPFAVDYLPGKGADLVISFASIGHDPTRPPAPEFVATATGRGTEAHPRPALFISDASRSWANDLGFEAALLESFKAVQARQEVARIATLGLSMGAFSALVAAQVLPVDLVLAFGPQISVAPDLMPEETRWADWTAHIANWRWPTAPLPSRGQAWLFHGGVDDLPHALRFPQTKGTEQVIFPDLSHSDLVPHLKRRGALSGLVEAAFADDRRRLLRIAASAGGQRRAKLFPIPR
ncbi:hypothetical protein C8J27_10642 [Rhodobacter aestuarii]|uniref:Esterase n=1 Tax=Rhodobacter aestuarii TaxID=453582 RepID=A0A1N7M1K2_9RHOB|nr:hypothetical protein [Rhodobacter aestuarii]PTV94774.1 hypothetical protein C8J27_10642 [Rhodobacter aestuarii]SIS79811.1 hypothetical protein SAMN05421580_10542 [Rhodobacter aestuarii]